MQYVTEQFHATPLVSSEALPWRAIRVEHFYLPSGVLAPGYCANHMLVLHQVQEPLVIRWRGGGRASQTVYRTGDLALCPSGNHDSRAEWTTPSHNLYLTLDQEYLAQLVSQDPELKLFSLCERLKFTDPLLRQLSRQLLLAASSRHALGQLYVEALTNALCHQLIEHHATYQQPRNGLPQLPAAALARIDDYLEAHAEGPVTLKALASLANLSVFHFARLFKQATGLPPYRYVVRWKIQRAKYLLRLGTAPVAAIGDALGFASPRSFTAAFTRAVGYTPQQFQRHC